MSIWESLILGIVQGLTEFLPISSSGHLVLFQSWLDISIKGNTFEIIVHMGTLGSILFVFWKDIYNIITGMAEKETQKQVSILALATLPAVAIGFTMKDYFESLVENPTSVSYALILTGFVLLSSKLARQKPDKISARTGFLIGIAQAIAIVPGISRSGFTISTALLLGKDAKEAARFSFLMAIPVIAGAGLLKALDGFGEDTLSYSVMAIGLISSFVVGVFALRWLLQWLESGKFYWFGVYCLILGIATGLF